MATPLSAGELFSEAVAIMAQLRGPGGCPWDREQTPETIRPYTLEETYEVLDAIERKHPADLCEELGDLLLQVLFYAQMASEAGEFSIGEVVEGLNRKLIRRHPHVFGAEASARAGNRAELEAGAGIDAIQVLAKWSQIKRMENKTENRDEVGRSRLASVLRSQPALLEAQKLGSAAAKCGFDWPDVSGIFAKIREEVGEVEAEIVPMAFSASDSPAAARNGADPGMADGKATLELQLEIGDLLFVTVNLARKLGVDAETALRDSNSKFRARFHSMENAGGPPLEERSLEELEALWAEAKRRERGGK